MGIEYRRYLRWLDLWGRIEVGVASDLTTLYDRRPYKFPSYGLQA